ncbi:MAG: Sir2 family NAD-dependent protein deacetylase [Acidimicrobiales bacterium]
MDEASSIETARRIVGGGRRIVVLTGAGISTDSGIPDFRGPQGVWTKNPKAEKASHIDSYMNDPEVRVAGWQTRLHSPTWSAKPNAGHMALVELETRGHLELLVTQNIDGLHLVAGHDPDKVVEIHGTMRETMCMRCGDRQPMSVVLERVEAGETDPPCRHTSSAGAQCGGILKSATISFGQDLVVRDLQRAERAATEADVMLAVGSTLSVYPAAALVPTARRYGAQVVIVNADPTGYDEIAGAVFRTPISEALPRIVSPTG